MYNFEIILGLIPKGGFMKKFILILSLAAISLLNSAPQAQAEENIVSDDLSIKVEQETKKYEESCYKQSYPDNPDDDIYAVYDDGLKEADRQYHQCIKKIISDKITKIASPEDAKKMVQALNKIEEGTLELYWLIYNRQDNGYVGRLQNDATLGRRFDDILEDIIHYQHLYENN